MNKDTRHPETLKVVGGDKPSFSEPVMAAGGKHLGDCLGFAFLGELGEAHSCGLYSVTNPVGQYFGPLVNRLVCNANCFSGGGDISTQQFNGFLLFHEPYLTTVQCFCATEVKNIFDTVRA